jgi:HAE1 family hydrophobic/amphiphilic exporter-1
MAQTKFKENGEEYDITILMDKNFVDSPEKIKDLPVVTRSGVFKLSDLADIKFTAGPTKILHKDKYLTIRLTGANAPGVPLGDITSEIDKRMAELNFPEGYSFVWGGSAKIFQQMMMDLAFAFALGILLTYLLLAAMLESFIQPVYIMMTIPLGLIGVVLIAYFTNTDMSITALMGVILLTGIVVNNAILILDFTNQLVRDEGKHIKDALVFATISKLKPILMSNAALALGMLPLALGMGDAGVEIRQPLGIVSIGGIIASTILTLYIIPAFYLLLHKEKKIA